MGKGTKKIKRILQLKSKKAQQGQYEKNRHPDVDSSRCYIASRTCNKQKKNVHYQDMESQQVNLSFFFYLSLVSLGTFMILRVAFLLIEIINSYILLLIV